MICDGCSEEVDKVSTTPFGILCDQCKKLAYEEEGGGGRTKLVNKFEEAVREDEMKGGGEPEEYEEKGERYKKAKEKLLKYINKLEKEAK